MKSLPERPIIKLSKEDEDLLSRCAADLMTHVKELGFEVTEQPLLLPDLVSELVH